jgi:integrase
VAVYKRSGKNRTKPWVADYYCNGERVRSLFRTRDEALHCERSELASIASTGLPLRVKDREKYTVRDIVEHYLLHKASANEGARDDIIRLGGRINKETGEIELDPGKGFLKYEICKKGLPYVTRQDAIRWMKQRRGETYTVWNAPDSEPKQITPRTVRREMNLWVQIFQTAIDEFPGCERMPNIFAGIRVRGSKFRRKRRLVGNELERLIAACEHCHGLNTYYVPIAITLFVDTGMRLQELFNLTWDDIDFEKRRITIRESKTDYMRECQGRTIVLPFTTAWYLFPLAIDLLLTNKYRPDATLFPLSANAFQQAFSKVAERANIIPRLTRHDLRHEATSRMAEAGLTIPECKAMLGHEPNDTTEGYIQINSDLKSIQEKLDRFFFAAKSAEGLSAVGVLRNVASREEVMKEELKRLQHRMEQLKAGKDPNDLGVLVTIGGPRLRERSKVIPLRPVWKSSLA